MASGPDISRRAARAEESRAVCVDTVAPYSSVDILVVK